MLYKYYGNSNENIYNKTIPKDLFSSDLKTILEKSIKASKANIERIKNSPNPTDKPLLLEGSVFSSLYEGFTTYKIKSIQIMESTNPIGTAAKVTIEFEYSGSSPHIIWTDKVHLVDSFDAGWRIDNIIFEPALSGGVEDLKKRLNYFLLNP